jgi:hypothetical protein
MTENERIIHHLVNSISETVEKGIAITTLFDCLSEVASSKEYSEQQSYLLNVYSLAAAISQEAVKCMNALSDQRVNAMVDSIVKLTTQQATAPQLETVVQKKQVFTTSDVMKILNIKKRDTAIKYFKNGTIKATQIENSNRWIVQRQDLANYLHTDNF